MSDDPFKDTRDPLVRSMERADRQKLIDARDAAIKVRDNMEEQIERLVAERDRWREEALAWRNCCTGRHGSQAACVNVQRFASNQSDEPR